MAKNYNQLFQQGPLAFVNTYSCNPDSDLAGRLGVEDPVKFNVKAKSGKDYFLKTVPMGDRIGYLDFQKIAHQNDPYIIMGQIKVTGDYTPDPTKVASYFLPWETERVISLQIPPMQAHRPGVPYFFTAGINGCSIFIKGTRQSPVVYHAGGNTGYEKDPKKGAAFWRKLLETHAATKSRNAGKSLAEVNKVQYTVDKVTSIKTNAGVSMLQKLGTAHSRQFETWLQGNTPGGFTIEDVAPTGCVFGLRDNFGDWTFYLQENATIRYTTFVNDPTTGALTQRRYSVMRPMQVTQFYPGVAHAAFTPTMPRMLKV